MATCLAPSLGSKYFSNHGEGRLNESQREALRSDLLRDLATRPGMMVNKAVEDEVDKFLSNGRISDSNLARLERRAYAMCNGAMSARVPRSEEPRNVGENISDFSVAHSASPRLGARTGSRLVTPTSVLQSEGLRSGLAMAPELALIPEGPMSKWSEVAKYSKALELRDAQEKRQTKRLHQQKMAQDLQAQMAAKRDQKNTSKDEDKRLLELSAADLERWKADQSDKANEARLRSLAVTKERHTQNVEKQKRLEYEVQQQAAEDSMLVQQAAFELDQEKRRNLERKEESKRKQQQWVTESQGKKYDKSAQHEDERRKVEEYQQMLKEQEKRNRPAIPAVRGVDAVVEGPPSARRGKDCYAEEIIMKHLHAANTAKANAESDKIRSKGIQKTANKDYLFQQIAERNKNRDRALDQKRAQKLQVEAASAEHQDAEKRRAEEAKMKNVKHRLELEQQIAHNRSARQPKKLEDQMSVREKAINVHLIQEAEEFWKR